MPSCSLVPLRCLGAVLAVAALGGCSVGEGDGFIRSERLHVRNCWNGAFDLRPDFFSTSPMSEGTQIIRIQRGDRLQEISDGLMILVNDTQAVRGERDDGPALGDSLRVGVARGVSPPGVPVEQDPDPPLVNIALYLHDSCHTENATLYSLDGSIQFDALFSGDINESDASDRLTQACFDARFGDPRDDDPEHISTVTGCFEFFFQRGKPAQAFP